MKPCAQQPEAEAAPGLSAPGAGKTIYFVRHGKTDWNDQFRYQGATDIPLNDEGRKQARKAAARLAASDIEAVFASPLARASETAGIIAGLHDGLEVEPLSELTEVNFGEWEGLTVPEIKSGFGEELFSRWKKNQLHVAVPGGETMDGLWSRACRAAEKIRHFHGTKLLVVGHGAMFRVVFPALLGLPRSSSFWLTRIDNCSISAFNVTASGYTSMIFQNDTLHLRVDDELIRLLPKL